MALERHMRMRELSHERHGRLQQFVYTKLCTAQLRQHPVKHRDRWERWLVLLAPKAMMDNWPDRYRRPQ